MNNSHLVSIIVPIYNCETYLNRCIDSILNQSYTNIEVILGDDGSKDSSVSICDSYISDHRVKVIHQQNGGEMAARSTGVRNSTGDFISFVDSDDAIAYDMIELMLYEVDVDVDVVVFGSEISETLTASQYCKRILSFQLLSVWNKLFRRALFNDYVFDIPRYFTVGGDFLTQMKIIANIKNRIKLCSINKYIYTPDNPNSVQRLTRKTYDYEKAMMLYVDDIVQGYSNDFQAQISEPYFRWRLSYLGGMIGLKYPVEFELNIFKSIIEDSKKYNLSHHDRIIVQATNKSFHKLILVFEKKGRFLARTIVNYIKR